VETELELLATDPRSLKEATDEDVVALLRRWKYVVTELRDTSNITVAPFAKDAALSGTLHNIYTAVKEGAAHPGSANRLCKELKPSLTEWSKNKADLDEEDLVLDKRATSKEIYDVFDRATTLVCDHPASIEDVWDAVTDPILEWFDGSKTSRSRSASRKRVAFADEAEVLSTPKGKETVKEEYRTPEFIPYSAPTLADAQRLARERDAAIRENHPDFDLLSQSERTRLREEAADSPSTAPEVYGLSTPPPRRARVAQVSPSRPSRSNTPAEEALTKLLIRDISPRPSQ
jgi:hypothetical protein